MSNDNNVSCVLILLEIVFVLYLYNIVLYDYTVFFYVDYRNHLHFVASICFILHWHRLLLLGSGL